MLYNSRSTVNMVNYNTTCALHLKNNGVYCRGTIHWNRKFVPKSTLFKASKARVLPRGTIRYEVNPTHNLIAVDWLDNKAADFTSAADTTAVKAVKCRVTDSKVEVVAPEIVNAISTWAAWTNMIAYGPVFYLEKDTNSISIMSSFCFLSWMLH
jgi:hypothetical protein